MRFGRVSQETGSMFHCYQQDWTGEALFGDNIVGVLGKGCNMGLVAPMCAWNRSMMPSDHILLWNFSAEEAHT